MGQREERGSQVHHLSWPFLLEGLDKAPAGSSAESELHALVEGAKEALGVRGAISHAFG